MSCPMGFTAGKKPLDTAENKTQSDGQGFGFTSAGAIRPSADHVAHDDQSDRPVKPKRGKEPLYYHDYLELDRVLDSQHPKSLQPDGRMAHEEMLFIIIHQTYELWFKQIMHDVKSCLRIFNREYVPERALGIVVRRLNRVTRIQKVLIDQMGILETMTPLDFLDFRDYLFPASGFQSMQFRVLENTLGLPREQRLKYARADYTAALRPEHKAIVEEAEGGPSLYSVVESWLERTPFLEDKDFNFWSEYEAAVKRMFQADRAEAESDPDLSPDERRTRVESINDSEQQFSRIFNEADYNSLLATGQRRLSYKATKAAILISLYRDEPIFQLPQQLLTLLLDMDENLVAWRNTHASMVHRMLGLKLGTGGSSGYHYLRATAAHHKIFDDFFNLSMFLIPRSSLPVLPEHIVQRLRFHYKAQAVGREQARADASHHTGTDEDSSDLEAAPTPKAPLKLPAQGAQSTAAK